MKNTIFTLLILAFSCGFLSAQSAGLPSEQQKPAGQLTKSQALSFSDVKALLSSLDKGRDYSKYIVQGFTLGVSTTESTAQGLLSIKATESGDGEVFGEKHKALIERYAKQGALFTVSQIQLLEPGIPGTPYEPEKEKRFFISDISFSVTE